MESLIIMKSAGLVQIFRPVDKERAEKMRQDVVAEFISASPYSLIHYNTGFSIGKEVGMYFDAVFGKNRFHIISTILLFPYLSSLAAHFFLCFHNAKKVSLSCAYALAMSNLQIF